ncbi:MAG: SWIM zinc finger family protein [Acidimicrobiia bacterium]
MSGWDDFPGFFEWGEAKEVEGGLVARRAPRRAARDAEPTRGVGSVLLEMLSARTSSGVIQRGRSYARRGQTVALGIEPGEIRASVQGALDEPYTVRLTCAVNPSARNALIETLARVLERPEEGIPAHGLPAVTAELASSDLLRGATVTAHCTCPFGAVCKHCIAVAILASERLDESPKTIATFLGVTEVAFASTASPGAPRDPAAPVVPAPTYDARKQARLARTLARLDADEPPDRDAVIAAAIRVLPAPDTVRRALGLPAGA